jgi:signal transduction histidine kinase
MAAPDPSRSTPAPTAADRTSGDSFFEASAFERSLGPDEPRRRIGWRRRALVLATLLGCLAVFSLARWLALAPQIEGRWTAGSAGELVLLQSDLPALDAHRGAALLAIGAGAGPTLAVDALLLHRWPRWQVDDAVRARQVAQHEGLARLLEGSQGTLRLQFASADAFYLPVHARGVAGLGLLFWPLAGLALLLYLIAVVLMLARPQARNLLFVAMALCQAGNLLFMAIESAHGLGLPAGALASDLPVRVALDLCTAAAALQAFALHPRRLQGARWIAGAGWAALPGWALLAWSPAGLPMWWTAQALCFAMGIAALVLAGLQHRLEPNPYALVMQRLAAAALLTLALVTAAVGFAARLGAAAPAVAGVASLAWYLFLASLLLLTPFLARSRQVLREFALLAGVSTVATSLDLLFVAVFSLGTFTSLAMAVFIGLGLYAGARQWVLNHLIGSSVLTTERAFDQLYRAAREVQARPRRYPELLTRLLRELFEPLDVQRVDRVPVRSRLIGGGSALVVPLRSANDGMPDSAPGSKALVLRFAQRGKRLFTVEDARLADRMVDQLRRAVAYDAAVERGRFEERQRLAQDLHDDIGARLLTLMYQAQTSEMEDYIRHTLLDLKTLTRGLAASEHRLSHAAAEWKSDLTQRLTAARVNLGWSFNVDRDRLLTVVQWSALTRVLRELVTNALYHGHATQIDVAFNLDGQRLTLQVSDDGDGRAPETWSHGLGLGGVRKRVKLLGGEVAWQENGDHGIVCTVRVPGFSDRS